MEKILTTRQWVASDQFSLADICLAPYFQTLHQFNWTALFDQDCPNVADWFARCQQRPSYQTAVAADFPETLNNELREKGTAAWSKIEVHLGNS
jgi:glutathione S-transferase